MKTIIFFSIFFSIIALPALGALTDADLDKIRLIVNDSEKRVKAELKAELTALRQEFKAEVASVKKELRAEIAGVKRDLEKNIANSVGSVKDQVTYLAYLVYALFALIVLGITLPQFILVWRGEKDRSLDKRVETLTQEVEALKQQRIVNP